MKKQLFFLAVMVCALLLPSCYSTRTYVGEYRETAKGAGASTYTYAKGKQCYLFWGLLPLGRTTVNTPVDGNCEIRTKHGFGDFLISLITGGLFQMQTIKVIAPRNNTQQPAYQQPVYQQPVYQQPQPQQPPQSASDKELDDLQQMLN